MAVDRNARRVLRAVRPQPDKHSYDECEDPYCNLFPCRLYREGRERGRDEGFGAGYTTGFMDGEADGYQSGFADGQASADSGE